MKGEIIKVIVVLGTIGGIIAAMLISAFFGNAFGNTMNSVVPGSGNFALSLSDSLVWGVVFIIVIVVTIFVLKATGYL
jgi:hypothetical protein